MSGAGTAKTASDFPLDGGSGRTRLCPLLKVRLEGAVAFFATPDRRTPIGDGEFGGEQTGVKPNDENVESSRTALE
jgi:hypothetical protein